MQKDKYLSQIKSIIGKHVDLKKHQLFLFGSRAAKTNAKFADYDIGIKGTVKIPLLAVANIKEDLEESNLPCSVDIVDLNSVRENFSKVASMKMVKI